jgi:hypothetical protein
MSSWAIINHHNSLSQSYELLVVWDQITIVLGHAVVLTLHYLLLAVKVRISRYRGLARDVINDFTDCRSHIGGTVFFPRRTGRFN